MADNNFEYNKWVHELKTTAAERAHDREAEFWLKNVEAAISAANAAIRISLLMNGGAAVAVLAFIGGLVAQKVVPVSELGKIAAGFMWFIFGVALTGLSAAMAYFTNYCIAEGSARKSRVFEHPYLKETTSSIAYQRFSKISHWLAAIFALLSLVSFIVGALVMHGAIVGLPESQIPTVGSVVPY